MLGKLNTHDALKDTLKYMKLSLIGNNREFLVKSTKQSQAYLYIGIGEIVSLLFDYSHILLTSLIEMV